MKSLTTYINEEIDTENLFWKIDTWFKGKDSEKDNFTALVNNFKGKKVLPTDLENYLMSNNQSKSEEFIDFLYDEMPNSESRDYIYMLSKVIDTINANKSYSIG